MMNGWNVVFEIVMLIFVNLVKLMIDISVVFFMVCMLKLIVGVIVMCVVCGRIM